MRDPVYDIVLLLHVSSAVIGFGAIAVTGWSVGASGREPVEIERLRRFFRPGRNGPARAVFLVPVLGGLLLALGHGSDAGKPFPWIGLGIWLVAASLASGVVWPAERRVQRLVALEPEARISRGWQEEIDTVRRRLRPAATASSVLFVAAIVVMVLQPG